MTSRTSRFSCDIRLADMACDSARAVGPGALMSSRRRLGWLEGKVKSPGFRRRGPLRIRYVPFSMAIEGEFWVARWVRKLDIGGAVRVVVDGVGCTFRVSGRRIELWAVRPRDRDTQ